MENLAQNIEANQVAVDKQLAGKIISYVTALQNNKLSWFWQLFSNAIQNVDTSNTIKLRINFKNNKCVEFQHNGKPFTHDNINAIVNQTTTKPQQLGLGLMSVFALTPNVEVQGLLSKDNTNTTFSINLIRQTQSFNKLVNDIQSSKSSLQKLQPIKQTQILTNGMTTRFRLFTSKSFNEQISILKSQILSLFTFNKELIQIQIINQGNSIVYTKPNIQTHLSGIKYVSLDKSSKLGNTLFFIQQKDFTIAIPIEITEKLLVLQQVQNSVFRKYPLSFQGVNFPFIINSNKFVLDIDRNKLTSSKQNNKIIEQAFKTFYKAIETIIQRTQQRQLLLSIKFNKQLYDLDIEYRKFISTQPIILLQDGTYASLQSVQFPLIQTSNYVTQTFIPLSIEYFDLSNQFLDKPINSSSYKQCLKLVFNDFNEWIKYIKPYELKQFIDYLPSLEFDQLVQIISNIPSYKDSKQQNLIADYFNSLYKFLLRQFPMHIFSPKSRIVLNSNYKFSKLKGLHQVQSNLPQPIIRFAVEQLEFDIKQIILAPGIIGDMFDLDNYQLNQIGKLLLKQLDKPELQNEDLVKILKFISIFFQRQNQESDDRKVRKHIYSVFRYIRIFEDVQQYNVEGQINFDYVPFIRRIVDALFIKVGQILELKDLSYLINFLVFEKEDDAIEWFNSFQQLLNILKCEPIYDVNLNQNNQFEAVQNLLIPDAKITNFEIELFDKLPVDINLGGKSRTVHQKLGNILLHSKINQGIFLRQKINHLTIEEFLESIVQKFRQQQKDVRPERSEMILDYCDNLHEQYQKQKDQDLKQKIILMKQVRDQTPSSLDLLRIYPEQQKLFLWRLTKQKQAYKSLKNLRRHLSLSGIVEMAGKYPSLDQSIRTKQQQVKKLKTDIQKINKEYQSKLQKLQTSHKGTISNYQKKINTLNQQNLRLSKQIQKINKSSQSLFQNTQIMMKNQDALMLKLQQSIESINKQQKIIETLRNDYDKLKVQSQSKHKQEQILKELEQRNNSYDELKKKYQQLELENQRLSNLKQKVNAEIHQQNQSNQITKEDKEDKEDKEESRKQKSLPQQEHIQQQKVQQQINNVSVQQSPKIKKQLSQQSNNDQPQKSQLNTKFNDSAKSKVEQDFENITKSEFKYDTQIKCYTLTNSESVPKAYLMLLPANVRSQIPHYILNKLYKIKMALYIGIVPNEVTPDNILKQLKVFSLQDIGIDKHYASLKEAESKQNAAKRAKAGDGLFQFNYYVDVNQKNGIRSKTYGELLNSIK